MFPDNTVLVNFAHINRVALLGTLFPNKNWCATVKGECAKSANIPGLADLRNAPGVFGAALYPDSAEHVDAQTIRAAMASPGDGPLKHLGEAETIAIVSRRGINALFVTDDHSAKTAAEKVGITVIDTWRVFRFAYKKRLLTADEVWGDCLTLSKSGRGWPRCGRTRAAFDAWLNT